MQQEVVWQPYSTVKSKANCRLGDSFVFDSLDQTVFWPYEVAVARANGSSTNHLGKTLDPRLLLNGRPATCMADTLPLECVNRGMRGKLESALSIKVENHCKCSLFTTSPQHAVAWMMTYHSESHKKTHLLCCNLSRQKWSELHWRIRFWVLTFSVESWGICRFSAQISYSVGGPDFWKYFFPTENSKFRVFF